MNPVNTDANKEHFEKGMNYFHRQNYDMAIFEFSYCHLDPSAFFMIGMCNKQINDHPKAIAAFTKAIELDPNNGDFFFYRAVLFHNTGEYLNALKDYERALELHNENSKNEVYVVYYNLIVIYQNIDEFEQAQVICTKFMDLNVTNADYYFLRGKLHQSSGVFEKALDDFELAIKLDPDNKDALEQITIIKSMNPFNKEQEAAIKRIIKETIFQNPELITECLKKQKKNILNQSGSNDQIQFFKAAAADSDEEEIQTIKYTK